MDSVQKGILAPLTPLARYLTFEVKPGANLRQTLQHLAQLVDGDETVVGVGYPLVTRLSCSIEGLRIFPSGFGAGLALPSTQAALWCWLRGDDRGGLLHASRRIIREVATSFAVETVVDTFKYDTGRDLTGYEDGTENPTGEKAIAAAIVQGAGDGVDGSSFVAVQKWVHDFAQFDLMSADDQDNAIGRRKVTNEELAEAPRSAHVKRTAQESFVPQAFVLRRSMPWVEGIGAGLNFVAFGKSFDAFEAQLKRMVGAEDGVVDALYKFTHPINGSFFWCPPMRNGHLDLRELRL